MVRREAAPQPYERLDWQQLMAEALNMPGSMSDTYARFYSYSFLNQVLLFSQGVTEPVATYKRWQEMGRQVKRGSKAKTIVRPITVKLDELDDKGEQKRLTRFKPVRCLFTVSETEGDPLPEPEIYDWSLDRAMSTLAIRQVAFELMDGNVQGYSEGDTFAINPVARYPIKTTFHELGHIVLGHTAPDQTEEYRTHRGVKEFQAEGTAYLAMNDLNLTDHMDAAESRAYIQLFLRREAPPPPAIRAVFSATDKILRAGRDVDNSTTANVLPE